MALCVGASLGALARWALALWLNPNAAVGSSALTVVPMGTLAANWLGAYLVGLVVAVLQAHPTLDPVWRLALVTGFLGALTTFSAFSIEVVSLLQQQRLLLAASAAGLHLLGSLLLTWAGLKSAAWWMAR
jgi:CrcB protein